MKKISYIYIIFSIILVLSSICIFVFANPMDGEGLPDDYDPYMDGWYDEVNHDLYLPADCFHTSTKYKSTVAPTCVEQGYDVYYCYNCKRDIKLNKVNALGHDFTYSLKKQPTLNTTGLIVETCTRCSFSRDVIIPILDEVNYIHTTVINATCTEYGQDKYEWLDKTHNYYEFFLNTAAVAHDYKTERKEATCKEDGYERVICRSCGHIEHETILPAGHTFRAATIYDGPQYYIAAKANHAGYYQDICTRCGQTGEVHIIEPSVDILSAALVLNGKIDIAYYVYVASGYTNPQMTFTIHNDSTTTVALTSNMIESYNFTYTDYITKVETTEVINVYKVIFTGVNPQCMGDDIDAMVTATKNGITASAIKENYSVKQYCVNKLSDMTISPELRTLLSDILMYGEKAQYYMDYKTNNLVTNGINSNLLTYSTFTPLSGNNASFSGTASDNYCMIGAGLTLSNDVALNIRFYAASLTGITVRATIEDSNTTKVAIIEQDDTLENVYIAHFTNFSATEFNSALNINIYLSNTKVGQTLTYKLNNYIQAKQNSTDVPLKNLLRALSNYSVSTERYVASR